ncbi:hypothetical protein MAR_005966 [Mya arenaria]|uniref:Uncharacterized protein n=1 Tax=Mya arenaria TaxID=6604 RepID=A0ABY7D9U5_MYAAR|nr:hypothetical protein MAR_005966 [Mya arenaria]
MIDWTQRNQLKHDLITLQEELAQPPEIPVISFHPSQNDFSNDHVTGLETKSVDDLIDVPYSPTAIYNPNTPWVEQSAYENPLRSPLD